MLNLPRKNVLMILSLSTGMLLLSGCATGLFESKPGALVRCPLLIEYSASFMNEAAGELRSLSEDSALDQMIIDYGNLRAKCRAIGAE